MTGGPLTGLKVVEFAGLGPTPHAAMVLADLGADVVQVRRPAGSAAPDGVADADAVLWRGRRIVEADLRDPAGAATVLDLVRRADVLLEGFRPGVMERLRLGPADCAGINPGLIYGRMTGWGQEGSWARAAGHDINYLAITGILAAMGPPDEPPVPPLSLVADFGGGSMLLLVGVLGALLERTVSGLGQVVDAAMVDGANLLAQLQWSWLAAGRWSAERGTNLLDGSAPFYTTYRCEDQRFVAVGAMEPQFYAVLLAGLDLTGADLPDRWDRACWPRLRSMFARRFAARTRDEWEAAFAGQDACVTPVLTFDEALGHPYARERGSFATVDGRPQAAPAPRFGRTPASTPPPPRVVPADSVLASWS